jgi:hypothetical protein
MRDKGLDDRLVLAVLVMQGESLNKEQIERRVKDLARRGKDQGKTSPQPITHRAMRESIERLEGRGEIEPQLTGAGRAPHTRTVFYGITELGRAALEAKPELSSGHVINIERAKQLMEERERKEWTPPADRAYLEMMVAYNWLFKRVGGLLPAALAQAKNSREAEKRTRTVSDILQPDLAALIRVCYRYRDIKVGDVRVWDYVTSSNVGEESMEECCRSWLKKYAPTQLHDYDGRIPDEDLALISVLSRSEKRTHRELVRTIQRLERGIQKLQ